MKYIIKESRLDKSIYNYLTELFGDIYFINSINSITELEDEELLQFINSDFEDSGDFIFEYIKRGYYERIGDPDRLKDEFLDKAPIVLFNPYFLDKLNSIFDVRWKPVFIQWMKDNFNLPVKTIID